MRVLLVFGLLAVAGSGCSDSYMTSNRDDRARDGVVERDNTGVNARDQQTDAKTPIDQNENARDINISADIRERLVDTEMSVNAQNVKIVTQDGKVTLRGPVDTENEKKQIEDIAAAVAGPENVSSELEVAK